MQLVLDNGTAYETFGPGEAIQVGMIVQIPDGRAAEVLVAPGDVPGYPDWMVARPWDQFGGRDYRVANIAPYIEVEV